MTTIRFPRPTLAAGQLLRRGLTWWLSELAELVPPRLMTFIGRTDHTALLLEVATGDAALVSPASAAFPAQRIPLHDSDERVLRARVQAATRQRRLGSDVTVRLQPGLVLESTVTLPASAEPTLRAVLQHQLERLVPLPARELCFDYRLAPRAPMAKELTAQVYIARRADIDRGLALAKACGLTPRQVIAAGAAEAPVVLWRAGRQQADASRHRRLRHALEAAAIVLALGAYGLHVYRLDQVRDQLQQDIIEATRLAAAARQLGQQVAETSEAVTLVQRRAREMAPLRLLNELTQLVPETTWLTQLAVRNRSVEIVGYSPRATDLIPRLENSALFEKPQFRAPITLSPDGKGERFDLTFELRPEPSP